MKSGGLEGRIKEGLRIIDEVIKSHDINQELLSDLQRLKSQLNDKSSKAEQQDTSLIANEISYQALPEVVSEAIFITDNGVCIECNGSAVKMFGYSRKEFIGQFVTLITDPEYDDLIASNVVNGHKEPYEVKLKRKDGSRFWGEIHGKNYNFNGKNVRVASIRNISKRKKYEEDLKNIIKSLQDTESKIRAISDTSKEAIFFSDKGICVECNQAACEMFGYNYEEIIGIFGTDVIALESRELVKENMLRGYEKPYEAVAQKKDGSKFIVEIHGKMYNYLGNKVRITTVRDLSAQRKTEKELQETEEKLKLFAENTRDIVWILDSNFKLLYVSPSLENTMGYRPEEFVGTSPYIYLTEKSGQIVQKALENFKDFGKNELSKINRQNLELQFMHKNGSVLWFQVQANVIYDHLGYIRYITGASRDINQWKEDEIKLRQDADIIKNIQSGILLYQLEDLEDDTSLRLMTANPAAERIIGADANMLIGKMIDEIFPALRAQGIPHIFAEVVRTQKPISLDSIQYQDKNIDPLNVHVKAFPLPENSVGVAFESLTKLKKAQKELKVRNDELNNFVYKVSHDLRAPLASIKGLLHLAKYEKGPDEHLLRIDESIQKLDDFIRNVLSHSRNLNTSPIVDKIDFEALIDQCFNELHYLPGLRRLTTNIQVQEGVFYNDSIRIFEIFRNMISNAIKYQDIKKKVSTLKININIDAKNANITIEDNGIGIEKEYIDSIFKMFYRASEKSDGSGIGLYIVQQAIHKINGTIAVDSEINQGTKFTITIPNLAEVKG